MSFASFAWTVLLSSQSLQPIVTDAENAEPKCTATASAQQTCSRIEELERTIERHIANNEPQKALLALSELIQLTSETLGKEHPKTLVNLGRYRETVRDITRRIDQEPKLLELLRLTRSILGEKHPETVEAMADYAVVIGQLGRAKEAAPLFKTVLDMRVQSEGERSSNSILSLAQYADSLIGVKRRREAEPLSSKALALSQDVLGERSPITIDVMAIHANVLQTQGLKQWAKAIPLMKQALSLSREFLGERHPKTLSLMFQYANMTTFAKDSDETEKLFAEAFDLSEKILGSSHPDRLMSQFNYIFAAASSDTGADALTVARDASSAWRERAQELKIGGLRADAQSAREASFRQYIEQIFLDLLHDEKGSQDSDPKTVNQEAFEALQYASSAANSRAVTEAALLRYADRVGQRELVQERQALLREWSVIEAKIVAGQALDASFQTKQETLRNRLSIVEKRVAQIDQDLMVSAPEYFAILNQPAAELDKVRELLADDEAVLLMVPGFFGWHSMAIDKDSISWNFKITLDNRGYSKRILRFRKGMVIDASGELPVFDFRASHKIYKDLVAPVEDALKGNSRVYVVADGALSRLPLGTLLTSPIDDDNRSFTSKQRGGYTDQTDDFLRANWLANRYALVQLPSLQSLLYIRNFGSAHEAGDRSSFAGFGAPVLAGNARLRGARSATLDPVDAVALVSDQKSSSGKPLMNPEALRSLAALPGTEGELEQVRLALGAQQDALYLAQRMTENSIRSTDLSKTRILHLATHGFTSEESGETAEPGLVFTPPAEATIDDDGYLTASEVVGIDLTSADWVILSACNTASPSGKAGETGLSGLAQAFFYAGAESLLVSHWPVFDDIAPLLTVEALKRWQQGQPRAEALQAAMQEIRNNPDLDAAHPAVWAPFTLVGEGR